MSDIRWAAPTRRDLAAIDAFYRSKNPDFAARVRESAVAAARFLLEHPGAGSLIERRSYRKWPVANTPYVLLYRPDGKDIRILRVLHNRQERRL